MRNVITGVNKSKREGDVGESLLSFLLSRLLDVNTAVPACSSPPQTTCKSAHVRLSIHDANAQQWSIANVREGKGRHYRRSDVYI